MERHSQHDNRTPFSSQRCYRCWNAVDADDDDDDDDGGGGGGGGGGECRRAMQFQNVSSRRALHPDYITITSMQLQRRFLWQRKNMHR